MDCRDSTTPRFARLLELLDTQGHTERRRPRDVPTWTSQTGDESQFNRVGCVHHDDRDRCRRALGAEDGRWIRGDDDVNLRKHQLACKLVDTLSPSLRFTSFEDHISRFDVSQLAQAFAQPLGKARRQHTDAVHLRRLLDLSRKRHREQAKDQGRHDEYRGDGSNRHTDRTSRCRRSGRAAPRAAPCRGTAAPARRAGSSSRSPNRRSRGGSARAT